MIHRVYLFIVALSLLASSCGRNRPYSIDYPDVESSSYELTLIRIEVNDSNTVMHFFADCPPGYWVMVSSAAAMVCDGKRYGFTELVGLNPDEKLWLKQKGGYNFSIIFPPLPDRTKTVDFIEGSDPSSWRIIGIDLKSSGKNNGHY